MGVCYRSLDQEDQVDEALNKQIGAVSHSQNIASMGDFHHPNICWNNTPEIQEVPGMC